jgi:hypothetical protein
MIDRRNMFLGLLSGVAGLAAMASPSLSDASASTADAQNALDSFIDALFSGDSTRIEAVLAPEFQVLRGDGKSHDKVAYLQALPKYKFRPRTSELKVTSHDNMMVVSYLIESDQTIDNEPVAPVAPRLTVFRKAGDTWLVVAHSNFAHVGK